ncbi:hypothetical protein QVA66_03925 [Staphylococcus chromogenes]|nr:hypothetical protein [Staphylococcus chromogenes]
MDVFATIDDLQTRLGETLEGLALDNAKMWLRKAHTKLDSLDPTIAERVNLGALDRQLVTDVLVEAAWRAIQDDRIGWRVRSEQWPENTTSFQDADPDRFGIWFSADELADLGITEHKAERGVFSISPWGRNR